MSDNARESATRIVEWADTGKLVGLVLNNETTIIAIARALLFSPPAEDVRREALEEAAKAIEEKHTNNVGRVHPMAMDDAAAIRALTTKETER